MGFKLSQIEENIIRLDLIGDFDAQDALEYPYQLTPFLEQADALGKKLNI